jgi:hypothetical protein
MRLFGISFQEFDKQGHGLPKRRLRGRTKSHIVGSVLPIANIAVTNRHILGGLHLNLAEFQ